MIARSILLLLLALHFCGSAAAQFLNAARLSVNVKQAEVVFDNRGTPWPWLGLTFAVNYDKGGQGVAYNVPIIGTSPCRAVPAAGRAYRPDFINIHVISDSGQTLDVGCNQVGNSMNYTMNVSTVGPFTMSLRAALGDSGTATWDLYIDNVLVNGTHGTISVSNTGSYASFQMFQSAAFDAGMGNHTVRWQCNTGNSVGQCGDINFFQANSVGRLQPPPEAQAAGFTTLAYNGDFSLPTFADPNTNWIDCTATDDSKLWHVGNPGISLTYNPCNIHQVIDPVTGDTVLRFQYLPSYNSNGDCPANGNEFCALRIMSKNNGTGTVSLSFGAMYLEYESRNGTAYCGSHGVSGPNSGFTWETAPDVPGPLELDIVEIWEGDCGYGDAGANNHANGTGGGAWASFDSSGVNLPPGYAPPTSYHRYGTLLTFDVNNTSAWVCNFVDDILQINGCGNVAFVASQFNARNFLVMGVASATGNTTVLPQTINNYVRHFRVWSCANWATGQCAGSTFVSGTQNGAPLNYWKPGPQHRGHRPIGARNN
jgi:hypothetical protein